MAETRQFGDLVQAWESFKIGVVDLLEDYNAGERGSQYPARLIPQDTSTQISVRCDKGRSKKHPIAGVFVTARAKMEAQQVVIDCTVIHWATLGPHVAPQPESAERKLRFILHSDGVSLMLKREILSPKECAERMLEIALLGR
jgi:hypothetical protein